MENQYYRIARIILQDETGRILIQRRSQTKKTSPNTWTDSASGHVETGETYEDAIRRETKEEIGIDLTSIKYLGEIPTKHEHNGTDLTILNGVFKGQISSQTQFVLDPIEVSDAKWIELNEVKSLISKNPNDFSPGFKIIIKTYY
ncbi:MAG: NUDIX domain-containing protein [Candidatus Saccharibacteria bacterium]